MSARARSVAAMAMLGVSLVTVIASCSKSDGSDPETSGPVNQAVERLHDFGLTTEEARCVVDEVGAETVVEATDLNAYADSEQYQAAAEGCIDAD